MGWPKGVKRGPRQKKETLEAVIEEMAETVKAIGPRGDGRLSPQRPRLADSLAAQKASVKPQWKLKAGNLWDPSTDTDDAPDMLKIPRDVYPEGVEFMWGTRSIRGQEMPQIRNGYRKNGWFEVNDEDLAQWPAFQDYAKDRWARDEGGYIVHEACILLIQRAEVTKAAMDKMERRAKEQLQIRQQAITGGGMDATGAEHPSALKFNKISRTVERIEIPKD